MPFHVRLVRDCAAATTAHSLAILRTRRAGGQYTQPLRIFRVQPPLISQIAKDVLGFDGYSRLGTADARRIAAVLEREGWERGKPAATPVASWAVGGPRCGGGQQSATGRGAG